MIYDLIIIGAGPAGLTAAIYARMANKNVLVLEKAWAGGQVANIYKIKNYPGFEQIDGYELAEKMRLQAKNLGAEFVMEEVIKCDLKSDLKIIYTHTQKYIAKGVIIATGAFAKTLDVKNEKLFYGKGVSYCATCDGNFYKDKTVAVVGGGNTSLADCLYLLGVAKKIYLIHRRQEFSALQSTLQKVMAQAQGKESKIEILTNSIVTQMHGTEKLEEITVLNKKTNKQKTLKVDGVFVAIGRKPDTEIFENQILLTLNGFIETNASMQTNLKNVYAVGDVRNTPLKQIVTAASDGAVAVNDFLKNN